MGKRLAMELLISRRKSMVGLGLVERIYLAKARIGSDLAPFVTTRIISKDRHFMIIIIIY